MAVIDAREPSWMRSDESVTLRAPRRRRIEPPTPSVAACPTVALRTGAVMSRVERSAGAATLSEIPRASSASADFSETDRVAEPEAPRRGRGPSGQRERDDGRGDDEDEAAHQSGTAMVKVPHGRPAG